MSRRTRIRARLGTLAEIGLIMGAMKNIALMETHKLSRFIGHHHRVLAGIEEAAADFLADRPELATPGAAPVADIIVAIGSQRGFCGDFNDAVARNLRALLRQTPGAGTRVVVVGRRLQAKLHGEPFVVAGFDGASVADEVQAVLHRVMDALGEMQPYEIHAGPPHLAALAHCELDALPSLRWIVPPRPAQPARRSPYPARLNVEPARFHAGLVRHYLWAQMHDVFYGSLMSECRRRLRHLEGAMQRMRNREEELRRRHAQLRQEEIIEEIEVILLSNEALAPHARERSSTLPTREWTTERSDRGAKAR